MFTKAAAVAYWNDLLEDPTVYPAESCVIVWMARHDSPQQYLEFEWYKIELLGIEKSATVDNATVVDILQILVGDKYICSGDKTYGWYRFVGHRWENNYGGNGLYKRMGTSVYTVLDTIRLKLSQSSQGTTGAGTEHFLKLQSALTKGQAKLRTEAFRSTTMAMATKIFARDKLTEQMDRHFNLLGFENGVLDLDTMTVRDGYPSDMLTMSTLVKYAEYDPEDPDVIAVDGLVSKIMVDPEMRHYLYSVVASCLMGGNPESNVFFFIGHGGNGKSVFMKLIKAAFGDYFKDMNSKTLVNGKTDGSSASPDIADTKGAHILAFEEIGENEKIDINMIKRLSGGTDLTARHLFQKNFNFSPMFTIFMVMNELFDLKTFNHAIMRRFKIIEFVSKFWTKSEFSATGRSEDEMTETEFWGEDMRTIPKGWGKAFMSIIIHYYKEYRKTGHLKHPKQVLRSTKTYLHTKDHFFGFIEGDLIACDDDTYIEMGEFLSGIREWNRRVNDSKTKVSRSDAVAYFQQHPEYNFDQTTNRLIGYKFRPKTEESYTLE